MNYNANFNQRPSGPGRKIKRVSDVNAMGGAPVNQFMATPFDPNILQQQQQPSLYPNTNVQPPQNAYNLNQQYSGFNDYNQPIQPALSPQQTINPQQQQNVPMQQQGQFAMFQQPIVQDMAMQYGQKLAEQGKQLVESHFEKYVPVTKLKYYFAVDNKYVINKLRLLFFPFTHSDWSLKYDQDNPVQPRFDVNAPDLYIPTMAYITYVVLAGLVLGMQNRFTPEQLGMLASSALVCSIIELFVYWITLYITNIPTTLKTLDLLAYSGYKFPVIVTCVLVLILFRKVGYYVTLIYCSLSLGFFLLRSLKAKVSHDRSSSIQQTYDVYGNPQPTEQNYDYNIGRKRKLYFLFMVAGFQPFLSFWLSMHLIPPN
ncbi:Protein YIF1B [Pseudolycoriella hygida]|uniref:Protein YIF1 n=1 Tax=Pseudolycoriella hygida TaxID=35572 RepID=A0A9Q0RZH7_9DIPT|nr:Protein YIF1B [Pseudolycoriella hygida]